MSDVILRAESITKKFPGVLALDRVSFELKRGEIHALLGENGAGKSTLVKILTGAYIQDGGTISLSGKLTAFRTPADAHAMGVRAVFQELSQIETLSVAENIFLGEWPINNGRVDWNRMNQESARLLAAFKVQAHPQDRMGTLGIATRQMVEILKGCRESQIKVLILDEPTSALSEVETDTLFEFLRVLKSHGVSTIYISHRLAEIKRICDCITILRNGQNVGTTKVGTVGVDEIIGMMVGRSLADRFPPKEIMQIRGGLEVAGLSGSKLQSVSFKVERGEVLGVAGLVGAGKTELLRSIYGADPRSSGTIRLDGQVVGNKTPREAISRGFGYLPESRKEHGLVLTATNLVNVSLASLKRVASPFLALRRERREVTGFMEQVEVRSPDPDKMVVTLSGGNQQKIILARWLMAQSSVMMFDEPTRGIDVGAKFQVYSLIANLSRSGRCIIVASSDGDELVGICSRIIVLAKGRLVAEFSGDQITEENLLRAAATSGLAR